MDREVMDRLHFDVRLRRRQGWVEASEVDDYMAGLPDVSDKIAAPESPDETADPDSRPADDARSEGPTPSAGGFSADGSQAP